MKKKILLVVLMLFVFTGCDKKKNEEEILTCTFESKKKGNEYSAVIKATVDKDKITDATATMTYKEKELADSMCKIFKATGDAEGNLECKDKKIYIKNYHKSVSKDKKLSKEEFLDYMNDQFFKCDKKN